MTLQKHVNPNTCNFQAWVRATNFQLKKFKSVTGEQAGYKARNVSDTQENSLKARASEIQFWAVFFLTSYMIFGQVSCVLRTPKGIKLYRLSGLIPPGIVPAGAFIRFSRSLQKALWCFSGHCWRSFTPVVSVQGCLDTCPRFRRSTLSGMLYRRRPFQLCRTLSGRGEKLAACHSGTGRTGQG